MADQHPTGADSGAALRLRDDATRAGRRSARQSSTGLAGLPRNDAQATSARPQPASLTIPLVISFGEAFAIGLAAADRQDDTVRQFRRRAVRRAGGDRFLRRGRTASRSISRHSAHAGFSALPMNEIADRMVDLDDALGTEGRTLREQAGRRSRTGSAGWTWPKRFVATRLAAARGSRDRKSPGPMTGLPDTAAVSRLPRLPPTIGWSRKHLRPALRRGGRPRPEGASRASCASTGRSTPRAAERSDGWADIAADCGYADQAHLVREFREFAGVSPTAFQPSGVAG